MFNIALCLVFNCLLIVQCQGQLTAGQPQVATPNSRLEPSVCRKGLNGTGLSVEIRLPFMDMEIHHERPLYLVREMDEELEMVLVLHGHELFQLQVSSADKRLIRLGELAGRVRERDPVGVAVVGWQQYLLLAIVLDDSQLEVYQLAKEDVLKPEQFKFEPIQEFTLPGKYIQMDLLKPNTDQIMLLITMNYTRSHGKCKTFEWLDTYFNPIEELTLPTIQTFQIVGRKPIYIISGRFLRSQTKLALTIYEVEVPSLRLQRRQTLTVGDAREVLSARFRGRNCLIACGSSSTSCIFFRMIDGQFVVYRKHTLRDLKFNHLTAARKGQLLIGARPNGDVMVFNTPRLDCYSGFNDEHNSKGLLSHRNAQNETFLLMAYRQEKQAAASVIRMVQLGGEIDASLGATPELNDDLTVVQQHRFEFEASINSLRSLLLRRKLQTDILRRLIQQLKKNSFNLEHTLHLRENHIDQLQVEGDHLRTPTQLRNRLTELRERFSGARRSARSFLVGNNGTAIENLTEVLKVKRLHVKNLIYQGDILPGYHLESPSQLNVKGQLVTKKLQADQLWTKRPCNETDRSTDFSNRTLVRHLNVERINNISWSDFYDSLFLRSRDKSVQGRLIVQSKAKVSDLEADLLNGRKVQKLFNTKHAQIVNSNIFMSAFFVPRLEANVVNGLNFAKDIVTRGDHNNVIKTPVRINQMFVSGDLHIANQSTAESRQMPAESPLQQYYTGRVIINGSLTVNDLQRDVNTTRLMLGQQSLAKTDLQTDYLLLETPQNLSRLIFGNARVTTPSLSTNNLNGHPLREHLLSGGERMDSNTNQTMKIIFMNATIEGDIICRDYTSHLAEISKDIVRRNQAADINGFKVFKAPVRVKDLNSDTLNGLNVKELVRKSDPKQEFKSNKIFSKLRVDKVEVRGNLNVPRLNGLPLNQINQLQRLELDYTPFLKQLHFQRLNGLPFDELLGTDPRGNASQLTLRKQLLVEGNVRFLENLELHTINGLDWNEYVKGLVRPDLNSEILGRKTFLEDVHVMDALVTPHLNGLDLSALLDNTLLRTTPQKINGEYTFDKLTTTNLDVSSINGVPANEFVNTQGKDIKLQGNLYLNKLTVDGNLTCQMENNFSVNETKDQVERLKQLSSFRKLIVTGDAIWPSQVDEGVAASTQQTHLDYLRRHAVLREGENQRISGHVILKQPQIRVMQSTQSLPIGQINFTQLAADALLRNSDRSESQVITAPVQFLHSLTAKSMYLLKDGNFNLLNGIDLVRLNASFYRRSSGLPIQAELHFIQPPEFGQLNVTGGLVNGAKLTNIYQLGKQTWPSSIRFKQLVVEKDLNLESVNGMNLQYLLESRIPLRGPALEAFGTLSFENLKLGQNVMLHTINGIPLDNVVYKQSSQLQSITAAKTFAGGLELAGPVHIMLLNGRDLSESFRETIFTNRDYNIDNVVLDKAEFPAGLVWQKETEADAFSPLGELRYNEAENPNPELDFKNQMKINRTQRIRLLYLDFDEEQSLDKKWTKLNHTEPFDLKSQVMAEETPSICQRSVIEAKVHLLDKVVHFSNVSQAEEPLRADASPIRMKVINYCPSLKQHPLRLRSTISFNCRQINHNLGMRHNVEELQIYGVDKYQLILLRTMEEVRVLKVNLGNCSLSDWQSLRTTAGRLMKIIEIGTFSFLLISGESSKLFIYHLKADTQCFELHQTIEGDFDLAELTANDQLILSCLQCRHIGVYRFDAKDEKFILLQTLGLQTARIQQIIPLNVGDDEWHLLVLTQPGSEHFYVFSYAHIEGWQEFTYGYMGEDQRAWPLITAKTKLQKAGSYPILLLCADNGCKLVKALVG